MSEGLFDGQHTAFYDLFRVENGKIAEHWDVIEAILPAEKRKIRTVDFEVCVAKSQERHRRMS